MAENDEVAAQSAAVEAMAEVWPTIDALVGGTNAIRKGGEQFLPRFPQEDMISYGKRLKTATLFPAFTRTAAVLSAKPFSRPISIEGSVPAQVTDLFEDVDFEGTPLQPFTAALMLAALQYGIVGVLADAPAGNGAANLAEEKAAGVRPYLTVYPAACILGWRTKKAAKLADPAAPSAENLTQLRLLEFVEEEDGPWSTKIVQQVRVLTPGQWEIWRKIKRASGDEKWELYSAGFTTLDKIPFVWFYGIRTGFGTAESPLKELAFLNVEHFQSSSDQQTILHVARVPILFAKGFATDDVIVVGASQACRSTGEDAELSYVEHTGAAIEAGRQSIQDLEDRMRQVGAELLVQQPATTTATQVSTESEGNRSTLQKIVEGFERSLEHCIILLAEWMKLDAKPEVSIFSDFGAGNLGEKGGDLLLRAASDDHVSSETVFDALKRADVLPSELKWADEQLKLANQPRGAPSTRNPAELAKAKQNSKPPGGDE